MDHCQYIEHNTKAGHETERKVGKAHDGIHDQLDFFGEGPARLADFPILPDEINLVRAETGPEYLQGQGGILFIQTFKNLNDLTVYQITVAAACRHVFVDNFADQGIVHIGKKYFYRIFFPLFSDGKDHFIAPFPAFVHFQDNTGIFLEVGLLGDRAVSGAD